MHVHKAVVSFNHSIKGTEDQNAKSKSVVLNDKIFKNLVLHRTFNFLFYFAS